MKYITVKIVEAKRTTDCPKTGQAGYKVQSPGNPFHTWHSKKNFDRDYRPMEGLKMKDFISLIKQFNKNFISLIKQLNSVKGLGNGN